MEENQKEIQRQFRQQQEKYVYYIVALAVSSIGFAIYKTSGQTLKWSQIPLAIAVLCWGVSICCGLMFIKYSISTLYSNNEYFEILKGRNEVVGSNPENIKVGVGAIKEAIEYNSTRSGKYFNWQGRLFYAGIASFITWHILEMYLTVS
jgi:hypothetical protein